MDRFKGLKIGIQSFSLRGYDLPTAVQKTKELGLGYIEWAKKHLGVGADPATIENAKRLCAEAGIEINCVGVGNIPADMNVARPIFEFARAMGVKTIMANPMKDSMDTLDKLTDEFRICVGIHNHGPTSDWPDIETIDSAIKGHSERIGLCVDTGHFTRVPVDPMDVFRHFGDRVHSVHLKDIEVDVDGKHGQERIIGDGPLDLKAVLDWLRAKNFQGPISIEYELNPQDPMADLRVALDRIEKELQ
ncbi:MAG: Inosose dehydratase [candidate division BRC1 bacterium ADurb.BinA364]|nr:MAG: Inosose dehydratase [candidate division BRC1 bacterium ADurb.BinA364]